MHAHNTVLVYVDVIVYTSEFYFVKYSRSTAYYYGFGLRPARGRKSAVVANDFFYYTPSETK